MGIIKVSEKDVSKKMNDITDELRIFFPGTSFELSSANKRDRIQIKIRYTDGPVRMSVKNVVKPFTGGLYTDKGERRIEIEIHREMSKRTETSLLDETTRVFNYDKHLTASDWLSSMNRTAGDYIKEVFRFRDFLNSNT